MSNTIAMPPNGALSFDPAIQTYLELWANQMPLTPDYFSQFTCEGKRSTGVITHLDVCDECSSPSEIISTDLLNGCVRKQLWYYLFMVTQELEAELHWTLSPRLVTDTITPRAGRHYQTYYGGISDPMAAVAYEALAEKALVEFWIIRDYVPTPAWDGSYYFDVPVDLVSNPDHIMIAEQGPNNMPERGVKIVASDFLYPPRRNGTDWRIQVSGGKFGASGGVITTKFSVFNPDYAFVYIPDTAVATTPDNPILPNAPFITGSTSILPVYPGTVQAIPVVYDADETYNGSNHHRYRVRLTHLVDQSFSGDTINLAQAEFYKLLTELDLMAFGKQFAPAVISYSDQVRYNQDGAWAYTLGFTDVDDYDGIVQSQDTTYACVEVLDSVRGLIAVKPVNLETDTLGDLVWDTTGRAVMEELTICETLPSTGEPKNVRISYAVDPYAAGLNVSSAIETLRYAIACRTAAELPLDDCGCKVDCGFIAQMRQYLDTTVYTPTGGKIVALRHGKQEGQQVFTKALDEAPRVRRAAV